MIGRPSTFTQETADNICSRLAEGRSLRSICRDDDDMPSIGTVMRWLADSETFQQQYARAREEQADTLADEIVSISDEREGRAIVAGEEVSVVFDSTAVARNRLRVDARKWVASKLKPKKYGDKLELAGDKDSPLTVQIVKYGDDSSTS